MCKIEISKRLKIVLDKMGIKKTQLAKNIGVSPALISKWINITNPGSINAIHFKLLCDCVHIDPNWLLTGKIHSYNKGDDFILKCYRSYDNQIQFQFKLKAVEIIG